MDTGLDELEDFLNDLQTALAGINIDVSSSAPKDWATVIAGA